jgi:hypothetical protein
MGLRSAEGGAGHGVEVGHPFAGEMVLLQVGIAAQHHPTATQLMKKELYERLLLQSLAVLVQEGQEQQAAPLRPKNCHFSAEGCCLCTPGCWPSA